MEILPMIIGWAVWFGATAVILRVDERRQRALAEARGEVDFASRSPSAYLGLALLCGPLPLLVYFWATRRTLGGALTGGAWAALVMLLVGLVIGGAGEVARPRPIAIEIPIAATAIPTSPLDAPTHDAFIGKYLDALRTVVARARPLCANEKQQPVDDKPSPAKGTELASDVHVLQVEVWCVHPAGDKSGFASLKGVPDARRLGGVWPQKRSTTRDPAASATVTELLPSGDFDGADQLRYVSDFGVEVDLDVTR